MLEERRAQMKVLMFHRIINQQVILPTQVLIPITTARGYAYRFMVPFARTVVLLSWRYPPMEYTTCYHSWLSWYWHLQPATAVHDSSIRKHRFQSVLYIGYTLIMYKIPSAHVPVCFVHLNVLQMCVILEERTALFKEEKKKMYAVYVMCFIYSQCLPNILIKGLGLLKDTMKYE